MAVFPKILLFFFGGGGGIFCKVFQVQLVTFLESGATHFMSTSVLNRGVKKSLSSDGFQWLC